MPETLRVPPAELEGARRRLGAVTQVPLQHPSLEAQGLAPNWRSGVGVLDAIPVSRALQDEDDVAVREPVLKRLSAFLPVDGRAEVGSVLAVGAPNDGLGM